MAQGTSAATLRRKLFEAKVHMYFQSITGSKSFPAISLADRSTTFDITFSSDTPYYTFGSSQEFSRRLTESAEDGRSCFLKPLSPVFPTFDSFLFQHDLSRPDCQPLIGIQIATTNDHPISAKGLAGIQKCLRTRVPQLDDLRPSETSKWIILFVVPESMVKSFVAQQFDDSKEVADWDLRTTQYVLGLPEEEVLTAFSNNVTV